MIAVDTSVWIAYFRGEPTWQAGVLEDRIEADEPVALTDVMHTEILHGLSDERAAARVERRLGAHDVLRLEHLDDYRRSARLYRTCRRKGVTIRRTLDCLIASVCVRDEAPVLHADADFDRLAAHTPLRTVPEPVGRPGP